MTYTNAAPAIGVVKTRQPDLGIVGLGGSQAVTYTYAVTNTGAAAGADPLSGVTLVDTDGTPTLVSDGDGDALLEAGETWIYTLTVTVTAGNVGGSHTNTATATALDDEGLPATGTAMATVTITNGLTIEDLERFGFHLAPTFLVLTFSTDADPARAGDIRNYRLIGPGRDGRLGTADDRPIPLTSAVYDAATRTVTLSPNRLLNVHFRYRITVNGSPPLGLTDRFGTLLDGDRDGRPGGDFIRTFGREALRAVGANAAARARRFRVPVVTSDSLPRQLAATLSTARFRRLLAWRNR